MSTGDPITDVIVVMLFIIGFALVLLIPAAILEWLFGPEKR